MGDSGEEVRTTQNIIVISGPSGSGKSTLIELLLKRNPGISFAVSHTTRPRRRGERNGREYYFVDESEFLEMKENNRFLEWACVHSHFYGTSLDEIKTKTAREGVLVLDLDVQGARSLKEIYPAAGFIMIIPPSLEELKKRLIQRGGGGGHGEINRRLSVAREELSHYGLYDFVVVNENLETAFSDLQCIYVALKHKIGLYQQVIQKMTGGVE